ncbi:MAG: hypothetical protein IKP65_01410 [Alphaproteobacteria bacterium]|nr:hypothetical protein [Alphaproteobacteria bacterium]
MIINVYSYKDAENQVLINKNKRKNWISIRDLGYEHLYSKFDELCKKNILIINFDDVTKFNEHHHLMHPFYETLATKRNLIHFNNEMAEKIIEFAYDINNKNEELNIHCWAGKSRSQAIGYCLNQYFNLYLNNNKIDFIMNIENSMDKFIGNYDVIKIMEKTLYVQ